MKLTLYFSHVWNKIISIKWNSLFYLRHLSLSHNSLPRALSLTLFPSMENPIIDYRQFFIEDAEFYNRILLGFFLPNYFWVPLPRFFQTWLRNYIGGVLLYFISGFLWCFYIYYWKRNVFLPKGHFFYLFCSEKCCLSVWF